MTNKIRIILLSIATALFVALPASAVTVGDDSGTNVEVSGNIQSIYCNYQDSSKAIISIYDTSSTRHEATYISANVNSTWCKAKVKAVADKFVAAGLAESYSESSIYNDSAHKSVELLGLQPSSSSSGDDGTGTGGTGTSAGTNEDPAAVEERCTSILPGDWCNEDGDGIAGILNLVLNIMTAGMGILATIGLVISGIQWLTARDKEDQIVKAKSRIFNIVIGIAVWGIMWLLLQWLLPGGINLQIGAYII